MKKLINAPDTVVDDALAGVAAAHADLVRVIEPNVVVRADAPKAGKVGVISGGGSGHEPMHGGFVGLGMLDAACPGAVFTSPVPDQMLAATKAVDGGAGVLHIVKNYTGDIRIRARGRDGPSEGSRSQASTRDDVPTRTRSTPGRRRLRGTVLAIRCRRCRRGAPTSRRHGALPEVQDNVRSMVWPSRAARSRAAGKRRFELGDDEKEMSSGSRRSGRTRMKIASGRDHQDARHAILTTPFASGDRVHPSCTGWRHAAHRALSHLRRVKKILDARGITIARNLVGKYIPPSRWRVARSRSFASMTSDDVLGPPDLTPGLRCGSDRSVNLTSASWSGNGAAHDLEGDVLAWIRRFAATLRRTRPISPNLDSDRRCDQRYQPGPASAP